MRGTCLLLCVVTAAVFGCGSSSDGGANAPTTCSQADRKGVYRVTFTTQSGTCGDLPEALIDVDSPDQGCKVTSQSWSNNDCKLTLEETCALANGGTEKLTMVSSEVAAAGAKIDGAFTITITGPTACVGTYGLSGVKQ